MSNLPKIAFLGLGDHGVRGHLDHLVPLNIYPEIGVFDPKFEGPVVLEHGKTIRQFDTQAAALAWADAVLICSPDRFHMDQMLAALDADCHVFCEKPLAASIKDLVTLERTIFPLAKKLGLTVTSCHPRRFDPPYIALKDDLPRFIKHLGKLLEVKLDFTYHVPSKDDLHGGNMLQDHANHEIDYLCFLLGVAPFVAYKLHDEADRYHMAGVREDGIVFSFGGTRRLQAKTYGETIRLRFDHGEVFIDTKEPGNSYLYNHEDKKRYPYGTMVATSYDYRFGTMMQHWLVLMNGLEDNYLTEEQMLLNTMLSVCFQEYNHFSWPPQPV